MFLCSILENECMYNPSAESNLGGTEGVQGYVGGANLIGGPLHAAETLLCTPGPGKGGLASGSLSETGGLEQKYCYAAMLCYKTAMGILVIGATAALNYVKRVTVTACVPVHNYRTDVYLHVLHLPLKAWFRLLVLVIP